MTLIIAIVFVAGLGGALERLNGREARRLVAVRAETGLADVRVLFHDMEGNWRPYFMYAFGLGIVLFFCCFTITQTFRPSDLSIQNSSRGEFHLPRMVRLDCMTGEACDPAPIRCFRGRYSEFCRDYKAIIEGIHPLAHRYSSITGAIMILAAVLYCLFRCLVPTPKLYNHVYGNNAGFLFGKRLIPHRHASRFGVDFMYSSDRKRVIQSYACAFNLDKARLESDNPDREPTMTTADYVFPADGSRATEMARTLNACKSLGSAADQIGAGVGVAYRRR